MQRISRKIKRTVHGELFPEVKIGDKVSVGDLIGTATVPEVLEQHDLKRGIKILVDEGLFVTEGQELFQRQKGIYNEIVTSGHDGVIKIYKEKLMVVGGEASKEIKADMWGRVLLTSSEEYIIEAAFLKLPIFVSAGKNFEGNVRFIESKGNGPLVSVQQITGDIEGKLVVITGALNKEVYDFLAENEAAGVLAPSIDWEDYEEIFRDGKINAGILQGFGRFSLWDWYIEFFRKINGLYLEADFEHSLLYLPYSDIMFDSFPKDIYIFKDVLWGKKVNYVQQVEGGLIAVLGSKEKTPVLEEELQKII